MKFYEKLLICIGRENYVRLVLLYVMMLVLSAFEVICAALFVPFLAVIEDAARARDYGWLEFALERLGDSSQRAAVLTCCVALCVAYAIKNLYTLGFKYYQADFVRGMHARLARTLLQKYLQSDYIAHVSRHSADLIRNVNQDTSSVFSNVIRALLVVSVEGVVALGLLLLLLVKNVTITLMAVVIFGLLGTLVYRASQRYTYLYGQRSRQASAEMIKWTMQSLGSIKETKVMNKEAYFLGRYDTSVDLYNRMAVRFALLNETPRLAIEVLGIITVMLMTLALLSQTTKEEALPLLGLFAMVAFRVLPSLARITSSLSLARYHRSSVDQVVAELTEESTQINQRDASAEGERMEFEREVTFEEVRFAYEPGQEVIQGCSLVIKKGATVAFVGTSGAGKTTLIDLLLGLLEPDSGQILVDGLPISERVSAWQRQVGYISQPVYMLNDTIRRNVAFGQHDEEIDEARLWAALEQAQLAEVVRQLPEQLEEEIGDSGVRLSGGQRQRIGIARVLYHDPEILVFDEATSALDNETEAEITRAIEALSRRKTIVMIAHRFSTIRHCDTIFVLDKGRVVSQGTYDELMASDVTFRRLARASAEQGRGEGDQEGEAPRAV